MRGLSSVVLAFVCLAFVAVECLAVNACPEHSWLERWDHSCACRNEKWQPVPFVYGCYATFDRGFCEGHCKPTPSHRPGHQRRHEQVQMAEVQACPFGLSACPIDASDLSVGYECISTTEDLDNCGGCVSLGLGNVCGAEPGVKYAACIKGVCEDYSCRAGYKLDNKTCVVN